MVISPVGVPLSCRSEAQRKELGINVPSMMIDEKSPIWPKQNTAPSMGEGAAARHFRCSLLTALMVALLITNAESLAFVKPHITRQTFLAMGSTVALLQIHGQTVSAQPSPALDWSPTNLRLMTCDQAAATPGDTWEMARYPDPLLRRSASPVPSSVRTDGCQRR